MALARQGPPCFCRCPEARTSFSVGFSAAPRTCSRRTRNRGLVGRDPRGSNTWRLGREGNLTSAYVLSSFDRRQECPFASCWQGLILRMERSCALLGSDGRRALPAAGRLGLSKTVGWRRAACRMHCILCTSSRVSSGRCDGCSTAGGVLWWMDHPRSVRTI